jgi:putative transposase
LRFTEHFALEGIAPLIGSVGDCLPGDNSLMETIIGLYKAECIRKGPFHSAPLRTINDVESATMSWGDWWNNDRPSTLGYVPPVGFETDWSRLLGDRPPVR